MTNSTPVSSDPAPPAAAVSPGPFEDFLSIADLSRERAASLVERALALKHNPALSATALAGKSVVLLFEKPSLRTRVSFEVGIHRLAGHAMYFDHSKDRIGTRESVTDYARNLERWVHCIVARVFSHDILVQMARASRVPVVNALSDLYHPCQALADMLTLRERFGSLRGLRLAYLGDGNNVCTSLLHAGALLGLRVTAICPKPCRPPADEMASARSLAAAAWGPGAESNIEVTPDLDAVRGANAVYTDTWISMGDPNRASVVNSLRPYQVNEQVMKLAAPDAVFLHCLPAHRGHEVTDAVMDSPASVIYDQAENRLHAQNALLESLLSAPRREPTEPRD